MRRWLPALVLTLLILFCAAAAMADHPVGGVRRLPLPELRSRDLISVTGEIITGPARVTAGETAVWTISLPEGYVSYDFYLCVDDDTAMVSNGVRTLDTMYYLELASAPTVTYDLLYTPGDYTVFLYCYRTANGTGGYQSSTLQFEVTPDTGTNAFRSRLAQIADSCRGADDFETVVNVHNWILAHNEYDWSFTYYSAEAVVFKGTSVCNGYARLFRLLMEELDIPVRYVGGYAYGDPDAGHAWNAVQIDGKWYGVDTTWDDGGGSLFLSNEYLGLTDELMELEHTAQQYVPGGAVACDSLESNYLVRSGAWKEAFPEVWEDAVDLIGGGNRRLTLVLPGLWGAGTTEGIICSRVCLEGLRAETWTEIGGQTCGGEFALGEDGFITGRLLGQGSLTLPADVRRVEREAFRDLAVNYVTLPPDCERVEEYAFCGSRVWEIAVPGMETVLEDHALDDNPGVLVITPEGSRAAQWADRNGIPHLEE